MYNLTQKEKSIIFGCLLGDGHIQKRGNSYRIKICHGIKQESYVRWKYKNLFRLCNTTKGPEVHKDKKGFESVVFYTSSGTWIGDIYHLFYKKEVKATSSTINVNPEFKYRKQISSALIDALELDPVLLAVLFMDDGSVRTDTYSGKLSTQGFSKVENHLLASYFQRWGIATNVVLHHKKKGQYYLSIPGKSFGVLAAIIEPIVSEIPEMVYKLNLKRKPRND